MRNSKQLAPNPRWIPSSIEQTCLRHLDASENWSILRTARPSETEKLSWRPFLPIFVINFTQYFFVLSVIFVLIEIAGGMGMASINEDLPLGSVIVASIAVALGVYVTHLYRRTWNRRAIHIQSDVD